MSKRIKFQQTLAAAALACVMFPQVASAGGKHGGGNNGMSLRSSNNVFANKVGKVSSNNLSSNVLKQSKFTPSGNFKQLGKVSNSNVLIPPSKLGNVVKPNNFKLKERSGSVFTPGKITQANGQGKLDPTKLPPIFNTGNKSKGPLDPTKLPPIFETGNKGKGPLDPTKLPPIFETGNKGKGPLDPTKLPPIFDPGKGGGKGPLDPTKLPPIFDPGNGGGGKGPVLDPTKVPPIFDPTTPPKDPGTGGGTTPPPSDNGPGNCPPKDNCHNGCNNYYPWPIFWGGNYWNGYGQSYCQPTYVYGSTPVVSQSVAVDATPVATMPAAAATVGSGDLILEDVILAEPATALVGPAYRVKFRNQSLNPVATFRVGLLAGKDGKVNDQSPRAMVDVEGLAGGQAAEVTIRLPRTAMQLVDTAGQSMAFTHLLVAIDIEGVVPESDKTNNVALVERASLEATR